MQAEIKNARKETLPRFDAQVNADVLAVMVVVDVAYRLDDGTLFHEQTYSRLPEEFDAAEFTRQANAMQADLDHAVLNAAHNERSALADQIVAGLEK